MTVKNCTLSALKSKMYIKNKTEKTLIFASCLRLSELGKKINLIEGYIVSRFSGVNINNN